LKIFVTGSTGFIGEALTRKLIAQGNEVRLLIRNRDNTIEKDFPESHAVMGDLSDVEKLRKGMKGCHQVYHLAALAKHWAKNPEDFYQSNTLGTQNLLEAALLANIERVVHTSTVMVIGPMDENIGTESTPYPSQYHSHYQRTKADAEKKVKIFLEKGLKVITACPSLVYGPGKVVRRNSFNAFLHDFIKGKPVFVPGDGSQAVNCVYLEDVVNGLLLCMERGRIGDRYILGGENIHIKDLVHLVKRTAEINPWIFHIPIGLAKIIGLFDEARAFLTRTTPRITWESVEVYRHSWVYSSEKAMEELGYNPRSLEEGIALTCRWLQTKS